MKKNTINFLILIVLVVIGIIYFKTKKSEAPVVVAPEPTTTTKPTNEGQEICYYKETKGDGYSDHGFISVNYEANNKVHGVMNWIPGEKDSLVGSFTGTVESTTGVPGYASRLNVIYTGAGEGIVSKQQEILIISSADIKQGFGPKEQGADGVYKLTDINNLTYDNPLPMVDCSTVPERIKTDYTGVNLRQ